MKIFGCFIPGADPDAAKRTESALLASIGEAASLKQENSLLRAKMGAIESELKELKRGAIQQRIQNRDPFANWPREVRSTIDYAALGLEEPDDL